MSLLGNVIIGQSIAVGVTESAEVAKIGLDHFIRKNYEGDLYLDMATSIIEARKLNEAKAAEAQVAQPVPAQSVPVQPAQAAPALPPAGMDVPSPVVFSTVD